MLDIEKGKTPLYSSLAGGRIGWINYKGPFVRLRIYDEFVVIRYFFKSIVLQYDEIEHIEIKKWLGLVADRIQIFHRKQDVPSNLIIGTSDPTEAKKLIELRLIK